MRIAAIAVCLQALVASPCDGAQPNAHRVLRAASASMGRISAAHGLKAFGQVEAEGRIGDYLEVIRPTDGAFARTYEFKLFSEGEGYDGHQRWKMDRSGATHLLNAPFTLATTVTETWLRRRGYLHPASAKLEAAAHLKVGERWATELTMRPFEGNSVRLAFDDETHRLLRAQWDRPISTITESYSDYRTVGGTKLPFRIDIEESGDQTHITVERYASLRRSRINLAAPPPPQDTKIAGPATLEIEAQNFAVVPATINGHAYDFIVDTGGHNIVTPAVAKELGLASEGSGTSGGSGEGRVATSDTLVRELQVGSARMTNQHFTILDLGPAVKRKNKPDLGGILGLEIFERATVTIDEPNRRLTIEPFAEATGCPGQTIPLLFDDDQPAVEGSIDGISAQIGIDVGNAGIPIALWRWAEAHNIADRFNNGVKGQGRGVGGSNVTSRTSHHNIDIRGAALRDVDVSYATSKAGYFSSRADSMNLGRSLLQKYVVRFDYARGKLCLTTASS